MKLDINGTEYEGNITEEILEEKIMSLPSDDIGFVILLKDELSYMQTSGNLKDGFILEYQEGSLNEHYTCTNQPLTNSQLTKAFKNYLNNDDSWKTELSWELHEISGGGSISKLLNVIVILVILSFILAIVLVG